MYMNVHACAHAHTHTHTHTHTHRDWARTTCNDLGFLFLTLFLQNIHVHKCTYLCTFTCAIKCQVFLRWVRKCGMSDHFLLKSMTHVTVTPTFGHTFLLREVHHIHLCNVVIQMSSGPEMRQEMCKSLAIFL